MNILLWHVHGSWTTSFVQGPHQYLLPVLPDRGPDGRGRAQTWDWPPGAREVTPEDLRDEDVDVVVLQRPHEADLVEAWTGRRPGRDLPVVYLEHNAPTAHAVTSRHPSLEDDRLLGSTLVHVTHFNALCWDNGSQPVRVVEHGIPDPGHRWTGEDASLAVVVNEPIRRTRVAGTDLVLDLAADLPLHAYGMGTAELGAAARDRGARGLSPETCHDLSQGELHRQLARHRVYLHPYRWTSLGLSLVEAMTLGMPVLAVSSTEAPEAVPPGTGVVTNDPGLLREVAHRWLLDREEAERIGTAARHHALRRFGLDRFLADWDHLLKEATA